MAQRRNPSSVPSLLISRSSDGRDDKIDLASVRREVRSAEDVSLLAAERSRMSEMGYNSSRSMAWWSIAINWTSFIRKGDMISRSIIDQRDVASVLTKSDTVVRQVILQEATLDVLDRRSIRKRRTVVT